MVLSVTMFLRGTKSHKRNTSALHEARRRSTVYRNQNVETFLKENGFKSINKPRKFRPHWFSCSSETIYPIHLASVDGDKPQMLMLLAAKADPWSTTSKGRTAISIAEACDENGSHFAVLDLLHLLQQSAAAPAAPPPPGDPPTEMTKSGNLETLLSEPVMKVDI